MLTGRWALGAAVGGGGLCALARYGRRLRRGPDRRGEAVKTGRRGGNKGS